MAGKIRQLVRRINNYISVKFILIYFSLMAVLYIFSLFGSMFGNADFTYAEF